MRPLLLASLLALPPLASCSSKGPPPPTTASPHIPKIVASALASATRPPPPFPVVPSRALAQLGEGAQGPYLLARPEGAWVVWARPEAGALQWEAQALGASGEAKGPTKVLGKAPSSMSITSLRPMGASGALMLWARPEGSGHKLEAMPIGEAGDGGEVKTIYQGAEPPAFADAVRAGGAAHVYFALQVGSSVRMLVSALGPRADVQRSAQIVADQASAWQLVPTGEGSLFVSLRPDEKQANKASLVVAPVDEKGAVGDAQTIASGLAQTTDVDAAALGQGAVIAWGEQGDGGRVRLVRVDARGKVTSQPVAPLISAGEQALVSMAVSRGPSPRLLLLWDDLSLGSRHGRRLRASLLGPDLAQAGPSSMLSMGTTEETPPLLAEGPAGGFALVMPMAACAPDARTCEGAPVHNGYLRAGASLEAEASSPIFPAGLEGDAPLALSGLGCTSETCFTVAFGPPHDAAVSGAAAHLVELPRRTPLAVRSALEARAQGKGPQVTSIEALGRSPRLSQIGLARVGQRLLVATLTDHAEGSAPPSLPPDVDAKGEADKDRARAKNPAKVAARSAIVAVQPLDEKGAVAGASRTISVRAMTSGGVAIAPSQGGTEACVAWVARDEGDPELFVTKVGDDGKRKAQSMVTRAKGDVAHVAIVAVDGGYVIAWADTRDGNGELYAVKVDEALRKKGPEVRLTNAPGDVSEVSLLALGDTVLVAYSDSRAQPKEGAGDLFLARVKASDATRVGDEVRVTSSREHARAIRLSRLGDEVVIGWIEQALSDAASTGALSTLQMVTTDRDGRPRSLPERVSLGERAQLSSLSLSCEGQGCRVVVGQPEFDGLGLSAFTWAKGQTSASPVLLATLFAGPQADVSPQQAPGLLLVADDALEGEGRVRRLSLRW